MKGLVGGPLLVGGLEHGPPGPPLKSGPVWSTLYLNKIVFQSDLRRRAATRRALPYTSSFLPLFLFGLHSKV